MTSNWCHNVVDEQLFSIIVTIETDLTSLSNGLASFFRAITASARKIFDRLRSSMMLLIGVITSLAPMLPIAFNTRILSSSEWASDNRPVSSFERNTASLSVSEDVKTKSEINYSICVFQIHWRNQSGNSIKNGEYKRYAFMAANIRVDRQHLHCNPRRLTLL